MYYITHPKRIVNQVYGGFQMQHPQEYYIGLNISDTAIGWAVTDSEYHLLKANQKSLWGVRLFDRAETAKERRTFRYARRKLQRKNQRIQLLQKLFSKEIFRVDPSFFQRLRESKFICSDKFGIFCSDALFDDPNFTDCDYHSRYPTVYHLRKALLTENHPFDVRLVYLAIHHIVKHRGHFLSETSPIERVSSFETAIDELNSYYSLLLYKL